MDLRQGDQRNGSRTSLGWSPPGVDRWWGLPGLDPELAGHPDTAEVLRVPRHRSITMDSPALRRCPGYPDIAEMLWEPQKPPVTSRAQCKLCPRGICRTQASSSQACLHVEQKWRGRPPAPPASLACPTKLKIPREKISLVFCNILPLSVFADPVSQSVG